MGSRKDYERPPVANIPIGQMVAIAFVATVAIAIVFPLGVEEPSFNFCPNACDDCVDKVIMTPQDNISACAPVWEGMNQNVPEFNGILEQHFCHVELHCHDFYTSPADRVMDCGNYLRNCNHLNKWVIERSFEYLYTYQIQNAVQFDYCVQEYYKQHFGGDD